MKKRSASYSDSLDARSDTVSDHVPIIKEDADPFAYRGCSILTVVDAHGTPSRGPARDAGNTHRRQGTTDDSLCGEDEAVHTRNLESSIVAVAALSEAPGARLNEIVEAANRFW